MANMEPRATNELRTQETFILRKLYKDQAYPRFGVKHMDFWYEKPLYGRIDSMENSVSPKSSRVKPIPSIESVHFALDFVVDAYVSLRSAFQQGMMRNNVATKASIYTGLAVRSAIESTSNVYYTYLEIINDSFVDTYLEVGNTMSEILDFDSFFLNYSRYLYERVEFVPITKSSFMVSKYAVPHMSGLIIEVGRDNHAKDMKKKDVYIDDPNFEVFRNTAQQHGFMVDKNAPWRLVADLSSPFMQKFAEPYGVIQNPGSSSNVFDTHYDRVYNEDIKILKRFFKASYEVFVQKYPEASEQRLLACGGNQRVVSRRMRRAPFDEAAFERKYPESFWLQFYYNLRMREIKIPLTEPRRKVIIREMMKLLPRTGPEEVTKLINTKAINLSANRWWSWEPNLAEEP